MAKRWRDLLTVLVAFPILALFARAWLAELAVPRREIILATAAFLIATALARALAERLAYHRTEGALAHFALRGTDALGFVVPLLAGGIVILLCGMIAITGLPRASLAVWLAAGVAIGLLLAAARRAIPRPTTGLVPTPIRMLGHRRAMVLATILSVAVGAVCALLPSDSYLDAITAGIFTLAVATITGQVDAMAVRYMAMVGHSPATMLRKVLPPQLALLMPFAAVLAVAQVWTAAGVAAVAAIGLPAITALRILAYRAFARMLADWLVAILVAIAAYLTLSLPPLGPLAILAAILWLARRGRGTRWLIE